MRQFFVHMIAENEGIQSGGKEDGNGVLNGVNYGFPHYVETGVDHEGNPGQFIEGADQIVEFSVGFAGDTLHSAGAVGVHDPRHLAGHGRFESQRSFHVGGLLVILEVLIAVLMENGRGEGAKFFAKFYLAIQAFLDVGAARIGKNRSVAKRARTEFCSALHPANNFSLCKELCGSRERLFLKVAVPVEAV